MSLTSEPIQRAERVAELSVPPLPLTQATFGDLMELAIDERARTDKELGRVRAEIDQMYEIFRQITTLSKFGHVVDYNEIHTDVMNELRAKIDGELRMGETETVILKRMIFGAPSGTVAKVASSEAAWLYLCGAARAATNDEIKEAQSNSAPGQPPMKSWTRSRLIHNACKGTRSHERIK